MSPTTGAVLVEGLFKGTHEGTWRGPELEGVLPDVKNALPSVGSVVLIVRTLSLTGGTP